MIANVATPSAGSTPAGAASSSRSVFPGRQSAMVFIMVAVIAIVDVLYPHFSFAILFAIPLVLLAHMGRPRLMWAATFVFVALTFIEYFVKATLHPPETGPQYFSFRLLNRALVAAMMCLLGMAMRFWMSTETEEPPPATPALRREQRLWFRATALNRKFDARLASFIFPVLIIWIAITDLVLPANFNFAILYAIPLFISAWTRSRTVLWIVLAVVLLLTIVCYSYGPVATGGATHGVLRMNRFFSAVSMLAVTIMLNAWITEDLRKMRWIRMGRKSNH
jgi:hypothetical protein